MFEGKIQSSAFVLPDFLIPRPKDVVLYQLETMFFKQVHVIFSSTYNHSGNFKQHLLKHERESGSISALLVAKASEAGATSLDDVLNIVATSNIVTPKPKSSVKSGGHPITRTPGRNLYTCEQCGRKYTLKCKSLTNKTGYIHLGLKNKNCLLRD